eukprot:15473113-Alexandrium_andersonii.AAC.1
MGWAAAARPGPLTAAGARQFARENLFRSASYWQAMLRSREIFAKGAGEIHHGKPRSYFQCLLDLRAED